MTFSRLPLLLTATFALLALGARGGCNIFGCSGPDEGDYLLTLPYVAQAPDGGSPASDPCQGATDCNGRCPAPLDRDHDDLINCSCEVTDGGTGAALTCNYHTSPPLCRTGG